MFGSYRRIFLAIGIASLLATIAGGLIFLQACNAQRFYEHQTEQNAKSYRDTARIHAERACAAVARSKAFECVHEQYHAAWERERNQYDLQAQLVTSAWTRAMGLAAIVAMIVGIIGVGLVFATFNETRRTADEAKRSADAFINAERPHIRFITRTLSPDDKNPGRWVVTFVVENFGQSAAILEWGSWSGLADTNFPGRFEFDKSLNDTVIKPGEKPTAITFNKILPTAKFLGAMIKYRSRFKPDHISYFLCALPPAGENRLKIMPRQKRKGWPEET